MGGHTLSYDNTTNATFAGYRTFIQYNNVDGIGVFVAINNQADVCTIAHNELFTSCSGWAAIVLDGTGTPVDNNTGGNVIENNSIEIGYYHYGIVCTNAGNNFINFNEFQDAWESTDPIACVYFDINSFTNHITGNWGKAILDVVDAAFPSNLVFTANTNYGMARLESALVVDATGSRFNNGLVVLGGLEVQGGIASAPGFGSTGTNASYALNATGITNSGTKTIRLIGFTGNSVTFSNAISGVSCSLGTISAPIWITLNPNECVFGTNCADALTTDW